MNRRYSMYRPRHSADKSFVCRVEGCDRTFYHSYHLYRHQRTKHGCPYVSVARQEKESSLEPKHLPSHFHFSLYRQSFDGVSPSFLTHKLESLARNFNDSFTRYKSSSPSPERYGSQKDTSEEVDIKDEPVDHS